MTRFLRLSAGIALLLLIAGAVRAETVTISDKDGGKGCEPVACDAKGYCESDCSCYLFGPDEPITLFPSDPCSGITFGGWVQAGYHSEVTPLSTVRGEGFSFNDLPDSVNLHQMWLYAEKALSGDECYWDWGFRADLVYGTDAELTQAFGGTGWDNGWDMGVYGWAMPQLYAELGKGDLSFKLGHFYTLVGYEVVTAPDNFFYSHALTMFNSEPFTHTGALATYGVNDDLEVYAGWTAGWDTGFERFNNGSSFLGGFSYALSEDISFTYINTVGDLGWRGSNGYTHSLLFDVTLTENLTYVLQSDLVSVSTTGDDDIGINQYLFYTVNDCLAAGLRTEWWNDDGTDFVEVTGGLNYRPHANVVVRPELRYDHVDTGLDQTTFGIDTVVTF